jgi:hypothetical protein
MIPFPWLDEIYIANDGNPLRIVFYADGVRLLHECADRGVRAPLLDGDHHIVQDGPDRVPVTVEGITVDMRNMVGLSIEPEIRCPDCGLRGTVAAGAWVEIRASGS